MEDLNNITVIRRNDPAFPASLFDFEALRRLGLEHIGELSGKIWTDHNLHDPGVTILEVLCYALLDLGYRTKLPIQDILALNSTEGQQEDNFFTPAQILTSNPTTILDYRKMLIDVQGVQNAWLEVAYDVDLPYQVSSKQTLNGLYRIYLQLSREAPYCTSTRTVKPDRNAIVSKVKERLLNHRNLCEDFLDIRILREEEMGLKANIELESSADPEGVYVEAMKRLKTFFNPEVEFYTLQELLDKGRSIEEIFEGRPYSTESFGFIDPEQLEKIRLPKEVHLSDLYSLLLDIEGIKSVRDLELNAFVNGQKHTMKSGIDCFGFVHHLAKDHAPAFCIDRSELMLFQDSSYFRLDQFRLERLLNQVFGTQSRARFQDPTILDHPVPLGNYRSDLGEYDSIQNEFPRVYRLSEAGMGDDISEERQAQLLQLKAYLLFFDQLLAGYLSQLANVRNLFAMTPDSLRPEESRRTNFSQPLDSVARINELVRFHHGREETKNGLEAGEILAYPVDMEVYAEAIKAIENDSEKTLSLPPFKATALIQRAAQIEQLQREFQQGEELNIETKEDACGFFFLIQATTLDFGLVSKRRYKTRSEALLAAESVVFLGTLLEAFQMSNDMTKGQFSFEIVFKPINYLTFLNELLEDQSTYLQRRNDFLDHLLARFSESFTDYSLLLYETTQAEQAENKAKLLSQYDDLSRNRGKAFNYCGESWDTNNVSGLEKRMAILSALPDYRRTSLCNFEVERRTPDFTFNISDYRKDSKIIFSSNEHYIQVESALDAAQSFKSALPDLKHYQKENNPAESRFEFLVHAGGDYALHTKSYLTSEKRDKALWAVSALFRNEAMEEDVFVFKHRYLLQLENPEGLVVKDKRTTAEKEDLAFKQLPTFIKNTKSLKNLNGEKYEVELTAIPDRGRAYLDLKGASQYCEVSEVRYRWQFKNRKGEVLLQSIELFDNQERATEGFVASITAFKKGWEFQTQKEGTGANLVLENKAGNPIAEFYFEDEKRGEFALSEVEQFFTKESTQGRYIIPSKEAYSWQIKGKDKKVLLESTRYYREKTRAEGAWENLVNTKASGDFSVFPLRGKKARIHFTDKQGIVLAQSPEFPVKSKKTGESWLKKVQTAFAIKSHLAFRKVSQSYGFGLPALQEEDSYLLESYCLYANKKEAWEALKELSTLAKKPKVFLTTGDKANYNYSFYVQRKEDDFIAYHPEVYRVATKRNEILSLTRKILRAFKFPQDNIEEYHYTIVGQNKQALLKSNGFFTTSDEAKTKAKEVLRLIGSTNNLTANQRADKLYYLEVKQPGTLLAHTPVGVKNKMALEADNAGLQAIIGANTYRAVAKQIEHSYKFHFPWYTADGVVESLAESIAVFDNNGGKDGRLEAKKAYENFVKGIKEKSISPVETAEKLAFQLDNTDVAIWPGSKDAIPAIEEVRGLLTYMNGFNESSSNWEAIQTDPLATDTVSEKYVYRVLKQGLPLAFHPCQCFEVGAHQQEEELKLIEPVYNNGKAGYEYLQIYLNGDIISKIDNKYHYVIRDKVRHYEQGEETGETHQVMIPYFISYKAYDNEQEALQAFQQEYLEVIELASCIDNYCFVEKPTEEGLALANNETTTDDTCTGRIWAYEPAVGENEEEANCTSGVDPLVYIPTTTLAHFEETGVGGIEEVIDRFRTYPIRQMQVRDKEDTTAVWQRKYYFRVLKEPGVSEGEVCTTEWLSTHCYDTIQETRAAFRQFEYLVCKLVNYKLAIDEDGILELRVQDKCPNWEVRPQEPCSNEKETETISSESNRTCCRFIGLFETLIESREQEQEAAWIKLEDFLQVTADEEAFIPTTTYKEGKLSFTFQVVDQDYHLARHPFQYNTIEERDAKLQEFCPCPEDSLCSDLIPNYQEIEEEKCQYVVLCKGDQEEGSSSEDGNEQPVAVAAALNRETRQIWTSYQTYCDCKTDQEIEAKVVDFMFELLPYAREERFYYVVGDEIYLCRRPRDLDQDPLSNLEAAKAQGAILAKHEGGLLSKEELIRIARNYPIVKKAAGYGFQLYCDDFHSPGLTDDVPCNICAPTAETGNADETDTGVVASSGSIVWESVRVYETLNEARRKYERFCELLQEKNIDLTGEENCGPFSMQLIDPQAILAVHPQAYTLKIERDRAIERTKSCVSLEGFHLVEHILLRPSGEQADETGSEFCDQLIPANPDESCTLLYEVNPDDPCAKEVEPVTNPDPCQAKDRNFEDYIPGADAYSFWASVVLPDWPGRFRNHDFREAFQNLLRKEAPAHIALNIIWVGPEDFCRFETLYRQWLRELAGEKNCTIEDAQCALIQHLFSIDCHPKGRSSDLALANVSSMNICNLFHPHQGNTLVNDRIGNVAALQFAEVEQPMSATEIKPSVGEGAAAPVIEPTVLEQPTSAKAKAKKKPAKKKDTPKAKVKASKPTEKIKKAPVAKRTPKVPLDPVKSETEPAEEMSASEKRRLARRRVAAYRTKVEAETDNKIKRTKVFEETMKFFEKSADSDAFITAIDYNIQYGLRRKKTRIEKKPFVFLIEQIIWRFLDQQVNENADSLQKETILKNTFQKLRSEKFNMKSLAKGWKAEELKIWTGATVVEDYLKLLTKK